MTGLIVRLCGVGLGLAGAAARLFSAQPAGVLPLDSASASAARVVIVQDSRATVLFRPQPDRVQAMVARGLTNLTGKATVMEAWRSLLSTQDVVGIKVYSAPGPTCGTRPAVAAAVVEGLLAVGLPPANIIVWDKQLKDLREAGFCDFANRYGIRVEGAADAGYDSQAFYGSQILGSLLWGDSEFGSSTNVVGRNSYVSKLVTHGMTRIINISPLLNNNEAGVTGNLFSLAFGSVDNTRRFSLSPKLMASAVPDIYSLEPLADRVAISIVDALICQYLGGERSMLHYSTTLNQLWFGRDPVALDVLSIQELERQRRLFDVPQFRPNMEIYENASLIQLGVSDLSKIRIERLP